MTTTSAWVESPLRLLSVLEAHHAGRLGERTDVVPRGDVATLGPTVRHLRQARPAERAAGARRGHHRPAARGRALGRRRRVLRTGAARAWRSTGRASLVVVDDGRATLHLLDLLVAPAGTPLLRARARVNAARRLLGSVAAARLRRAAQDGRLTVVTAYDVDVALRLQARGHGRAPAPAPLRVAARAAAPGRARAAHGGARQRDGARRPAAPGALPAVGARARRARPRRLLPAPPRGLRDPRRAVRRPARAGLRAHRAGRASACAASTPGTPSSRCRRPPRPRCARCSRAAAPAWSSTACPRPGGRRPPAPPSACTSAGPTSPAPSRREPRPPPRVVAVADSDSYLKWAVGLLGTLPADWRRRAVVVRSPIAPSAAQRAAAGREDDEP
nr:DUF6716 putative glycosyltransferase [Angustibacter aerolatus]